MARKRPSIPDALRPWIEARQRFRLSHAHVQMARELGMDPKNFGKLANHDQERWKAPLPDFIAHLYAKRFGKERPDSVRTIEEIAAAKQARKQARKEARDQARKEARQAREAGAAERPAEADGVDTAGRQSLVDHLPSGPSRPDDLAEAITDRAKEPGRDSAP